MIKACKWCGEKVEMKAKQLFCCESRKNKWTYANRTGKLEKNGTFGDEKSLVGTLIGKLTRVTTTSGKSVRIQINIPVEGVKMA